MGRSSRFRKVILSTDIALADGGLYLQRVDESIVRTLHEKLR